MCIVVSQFDQLSIWMYTPCALLQRILCRQTSRLPSAAQFRTKKRVATTSNQDNHVLIADFGLLRRKQSLCKYSFRACNMLAADYQWWPTDAAGCCACPFRECPADKETSPQQLTVSKRTCLLREVLPPICLYSVKHKISFPSCNTHYTVCGTEAFPQREGTAVASA